MQERDVDLLLVDSGDLHDGEDLPKYEFCRLKWSQEPVLLTDFPLEVSMPMTYAFQCKSGPVAHFFVFIGQPIHQAAPIRRYGHRQVCINFF